MNEDNKKRTQSKNNIQTSKSNNANKIMNNKEIQGVKTSQGYQNVKSDSITDKNTKAIRDMKIDTIINKSAKSIRNMKGDRITDKSTKSLRNVKDNIIIDKNTKTDKFVKDNSKHYFYDKYDDYEDFEDFEKPNQKGIKKGFTKDKKPYNRLQDIDGRKEQIKNKKVDQRTQNRTADVSAEKKDRPAVKKDACPYLRDCGGCNILRQSYEDELKEKQKTVQNLLKGYCKVEQIIGMKQPNYYRNKVHVVFDHDKKGNPISGVYEEGTHRVVPIASCLIHNQKADAIIASIRGMLKSFKIKTYDEDSGYGLLRHVLIRTGFTSGQIMVILVLASPIFPSKNNFVKALLKLHPEITTMVVNVNDKMTSMVLGEKEQVIYGKGYIEDSLCGKIFRISPKSFYQVNPAQTEVIYGKAIEMAGLTGTETVVDAYCGIGTIGIIASDHVKKVIGVELNKDAVKDANINIKRNEAMNIDIYNNDAGDFLTQMAQQNEAVDVVFMDPPRTGSSEKFMDAVALLKPKKVVYISCNPVTLERDLNYLTKKGYKAQKALPVDMFPWTTHVETVVLLYQQKPSDRIEVDFDLRRI